MLLNKVDLLAAGKLEHLTDIIASLNPLATVRAWRVSGGPLSDGMLCGNRAALPAPLRQLRVSSAHHTACWSTRECMLASEGRG